METWQILAMILGPTGATSVAAVATLKVLLNGARSDITEIKEDVKELRRGHEDHGNRITILETKLGD